MQIESICFGNYKNVQKKKVSKKAYPPMTKRKLKKCEPFFISYERVEKKKEHTKTNLRFIFCVANVAVMAKATAMAAAMAAAMATAMTAAMAAAMAAATAAAWPQQ